MSGSMPIGASSSSSANDGGVAPTPQNTPAQHAPIHLSMPTVPNTIEEGEEGDVDAAGDESQILGDAMSSGALQGALAGMVQNRLSDLIGKSSGYMEGLPVEVKRSIAALQGVHTKQTELQYQFKREVWELEKKVTLHHRFVCVIRDSLCFTIEVSWPCNTSVRAPSSHHLWINRTHCRRNCCGREEGCRG